MKIKKIRKTSKSELATKIMAYGTTAAGLLAVAQPASAAIVFSGPQNLPLNANSTPVYLDMNNDGIDDFIFTNYSGDGDYQSIAGTGQAGAYGQFIAAGSVNSNTYGYHYDPVNFAAAYNIQAALANSLFEFRSSSDTLVGSSSTDGNFNNTTGYLGVRFHSNACPGTDWQYGWIKFTSSTSPTSGLMSSTIDSWAYQEPPCNTPIRTGDPGAHDVPTLGQWGMIIMAGLLSGAAIYRMRKNKKEA